MSNENRLSTDLCPVCQHKSHEYYQKVKEFIYYECSNCRGVFLKDIGGNSKVDHRSRDYKLARLLVESTYTMHNDWLANLMVKQSPGGNVLDVGCGSGFFVRKLTENKFVCKGIDLGDENVLFAKSFLDVTVFNTDFLIFDNGERYDWITMNQLIEHVANPVEFVNKCYSLLKPGGKLLITTPNLNYTRIMLKFTSLCKIRPMLGDALSHPPNHCVLFRPETMKLLLEKTGFKVIDQGHNPTGFKGRNTVRVLADKIVLRYLKQFMYGPNMFFIGLK